MALGFKRPIEPTDPRLKGHETTYQASRGGHFPAPQTPTPGTPKEQRGR
ncbi:hypothetical protein [Streptomyces asoensis]|uniref:Uncharacterized protein n=1 Tax=Streptomyces asoensis TaxID=249586 RepID=A0ABQ3RZ37_9ACTN|nr:hypothetical protein [Streptomyces asoensis]GGQ48704.1 hypothetical protein GCM10010496_08730 [Streptomyces asoensis]GHI61065.1 hypothetical protein Saso_27150 [Streptomyces asoensis]